jgi:hypothetical protein
VLISDSNLIYESVQVVSTWHALHDGSEYRWTAGIMGVLNGMIKGKSSNTKGKS